MLRLVTYLVSIALIATGLAWLADRPGTLHMVWQGYDIETSVFRATVILAAAVATAIFAWSILRTLWNSPAALGQRIVRKRQKRGLDALSSGMIAVGAGDKSLATRYALQARKSLPHEPLTHLLRAQAAQLSGDRATARRIFESMLAAPETEQLGLRGLFLEAEREGASEAARQFADKALRSNPKLAWSSDALFDLQCKQKDWAGALDTLALAKRNGLVEKTPADRRRAVLLAAQAQDAEDNDSDKALTLALESNGLAPDLVPAAAVASRILAARGNTSKAAKIVQKAWARTPHPDLAMAYAYARIGDSPRDRLDRIKQLAALNPHSIESPIAVATTAIEARLYNDARDALQPLLDNRLTQRVATLMARVEAGENGDKGRVREWLARAVNAARDPAWTADGVISDRWEPVSPVTGVLDAFQWRVPVELLESGASNVLGERLEELLAISAPPAGQLNTDYTAARPRSAHIPVPTRPDDIVDAESVTVRPTAARGAEPPAKPTERPHGPEVAAQVAPQAAGKNAPETRVAEVTVVKSVQDKPAQDKPEKTAAPPAKSQEPPTANAKAAAKPDAKIFVAPRAPDDPGPEEAEAAESDTFPKRVFRAVN
jgi:HemY protein